MKLFKNAIWSILLLASCTSPKSDSSDLITANIRNQLNNLSTLDLSSEIESVSYAPLEMTDDDASLIGSIQGYAVTDKYIYIYPIEGNRIVIFNRQGKFVRVLINFGQGPGEFNGTLFRMQADENSNRLYLYSSDRIFVYDLEGEFIKTISPTYHNVFNSRIGENRFAAVGFPYMTFKQGNFGIGIFTENSDTIVMKNDFSSPLVPAEKSGFTMGLTPPAYSEKFNSVLFKTGSNDTIFRISDDKIEPALVVALKNSDQEIIRSLDAADFASLRSGKYEADGDIYISDMFETANQYYLRFRYNKVHYVASVNKNTGSTLVEKCVQPTNLERLGDANILFGMMGTKSYKNFPIWGSMEGNNLVQIVTFYELDIYRDVPSVTIPEELDMDEESNPVIVIYKMKG